MGHGRFTEGSRKVSRKHVAIDVARHVARHVASRFPTTAATKGWQRQPMGRARFQVCRSGKQCPGFPEPGPGMKIQKSKMIPGVHGSFTEGSRKVHGRAPWICVQRPGQGPCQTYFLICFLEFELWLVRKDWSGLASNVCCCADCILFHHAKLMADHGRPWWGHGR